MSFNKIMKPVPIQRHLSPTSPRLQYPLYGQYGFQEAIGRKKYQPKAPSPIHQLIFNHPLPPPNPQNNTLRKYKMTDLDESYTSDRSTSSNRYSHPPYNHSQIYSLPLPTTLPHQNSTRSTPNTSEPSSPLRNTKEMRNGERKQSEKLETNQDGQVPRYYPVRREYQKQRQWEEERTDDSLDRLVSPHNEYNLRISQQREKFLDEMIRLRSQNPTFLNSHIH